MSTKLNQSSVQNARLTLMDELKLKLSRPKFIASSISAEDNIQHDRSIGTSFMVNPSYRKSPLMDDSMISDTTTDISEIDIDEDDNYNLPQMSLNESIVQDNKTQNSNPDKSPIFKNGIKCDEQWLIKDKPTLKTLWEQLMTERKEHHKTVYTLESLQNMYYGELQRNAILQNTIDKLRFSDGCHQNSKNHPEQTILKASTSDIATFAAKFQQQNVTTVKSTSLVTGKMDMITKRKAVGNEQTEASSNETTGKTNSEPFNLLSNLQLPSHTTTHETSSFPYSFYNFDGSIEKSIFDCEDRENRTNCAADQFSIHSQHNTDVPDNNELKIEPLRSDFAYAESVPKITDANEHQNFPQKKKSTDIVSGIRSPEFLHSKANQKKYKMELKTALQLYAALDLADRQSSLLQKRSKEMLFHLVHSDEIENKIL